MSKKIQLILIPIIYKVVLTAIMITCRIRIDGEEHIQKLKDQNKPWILSFWHNNIAIASWTLRNQNLRVMISESHDGEIIDRCAQKFGNKGVRGSTSSGSAKATRAILKLLKQNRTVMLTPDGPRGPKYELQAGVLWLSAISGAPVIPYHAEANRQWVFKSWDNHKLPKPFTKIQVCIGEPYYADRGAMKDDPDASTHAMQDLMMQNTAKTMQLVNEFSNA